jgi:K+-transporting ATPase ATPase C chain
MNTLLSIIRIVIGSSAICVAGYGALMLAIAHTATPHTADGSLLEKDGVVVGSRQIAQAFSQPRYFWPRLSAVDYDGAGAGGSNLAPTNEALAERAAPVLEAYGATPEHAIPADLVTASGSGLDPHISVEGAHFQAERVATARGLDVSEVSALIGQLSFVPGGPLTSSAIINVLELNLALDDLQTRIESSPL